MRRQRRSSSEALLVGRIRVGLPPERERATHDVRAGGTVVRTVRLTFEVMSPPRCRPRQVTVWPAGSQGIAAGWPGVELTNARFVGSVMVSTKSKDGPGAGMTLDARRHDDSSSSDWACAASVERRAGRPGTGTAAPRVTVPEAVGSATTRQNDAVRDPTLPWRRSVPFAPPFYSSAMQASTVTRADTCAGSPTRRGANAP